MVRNGTLTYSGGQCLSTAVQPSLSSERCFNQLLVPSSRCQHDGPKNLESRSWRTGCRSGTTSSGRTPIHRECPTLRQPCQVAFGIFWIRLTRWLLYALGLVSEDNCQRAISCMMLSVYAPSQYRPTTSRGYTVYYYYYQ